MTTDLIKTAPSISRSSLPSGDKDQGFTRPKILILAPFKKMAFTIVQSIVFMLNKGSLKKVKGRKRFKMEFGEEEEAFNDSFRIGIQIDKNMQPRLFESMFESDIIVASPIGIRILTGLQKSDDLEA